MSPAKKRGRIYDFIWFPFGKISIKEIAQWKINARYKFPTAVFRFSVVIYEMRLLPRSLHFGAQHFPTLIFLISKANPHTHTLTHT